ncbi:MAG: type II secretion system protein [Armatimonadota bacterium]
MKTNNRGSWSLIGLLAAAAIVCILAAWMFTGGKLSSVGKDSSLVDQSSTKQTVYGKAMDKAKGEDCRQRLNQVRTAIQNQKAMSTTEGNPKSLSELGLAPGYLNCPVSNQPYIYDPATGTVRCQYAGHANY